MIDPRFDIREDLKEKRLSLGWIVAFYGPIYQEQGEPSLRCVAAKQYRRNPEVGPLFVSASYKKQYSRAISEEKARVLHPRMFDSLEQGYGYSTIALWKEGHRKGQPLFPQDLPTLLIELPRFTPTVGKDWGNLYVRLLGTIDTIQQITQIVQEYACSHEYELLVPDLPATAWDMTGATVYNGNDIRDLQDVKDFLGKKK